MLKRLAFVAVLAAAVAVTLVPAASAAGQGSYLPVRVAKSEIKSALKATQIGTAFAVKLKYCYNTRPDRVECFFQTREWSFGEWYQCYGTAKATEKWGWVDVRFNRGWIQDCYGTWDPSFV